MLLQFSIENFKAFKDEAVLRLQVSDEKQEPRLEGNVFEIPNTRIRLLKSAVIYGANASGKSKLFEALAFMRYFVIRGGIESQQGDAIGVDPFRLSSETEHAPSMFEVIFWRNGQGYRYGFKATKTNVEAEWLYFKSAARETRVFQRKGKDFQTHKRSFQKGRIVIDQGLVRDNALLISVAAQFNEPAAIAIVEWFKSVKILSGLDERGYAGFTMGATDNPLYKDKMLDILKAADLGIDDIDLQEVTAEDLPDTGLPEEVRREILKEMREDNAAFIANVITQHVKYNADRESIGSIPFSLGEEESSGTRKLLALAASLIEILEKGRVLVVDELGGQMHPALIYGIAALFNSIELNRQNAQLIFNTHDTNLLSSGLFRRDQIWFAPKTKEGDAKLHALSQIKSIRVGKDETFEKHYLNGKYGVMPLLHFFDALKKALLRYEKKRKRGGESA